MAAVEEKPLSSFVIALSESPDLLERYHDEKQQAGLLAEHGLADHPVFSGKASLDELHAHVRAEQPNAETPSPSSIKIPKLPWIQRAPTETPEERPEPPAPPAPPEPSEPSEDPEENT